MFNQVHRVKMTGGLIGLFQDPQKKLQQDLSALNNGGHELVAIQGDEWSAAQQLVAFFCLAITLGIWCPAPGYMVITRPVRQ